MRRTIINLVAIAVVATACVTTGDPTPTTTTVQPGTSTTTSSTQVPGPTTPPTAILASFALNRFEQCDTFLDHVRSEASKVVGPYGLNDNRGGYFTITRDLWFGGEEVAAISDRAAGVSSQRLYSGTNVQELGVDEADIVKTDGRRIVALTDQELVVVDVTGAQPMLIGKIALGDTAVSNLYLTGDRVLVLGSAFSFDQGFRGGFEEEAIFSPIYGYGSPTVQLTEIDISAAPTVVATLELDGSYVSSRMIGESVRLVATSSPNGFDWVFPEGSGLKSEREAEAANRKLIDESTIDNWVPYFVLTDSDGDVLDEGNLVPCDRAHAPVEFSGFNMVSVVTIDLGSGLAVVDATGVLATGETVYASADSLYVATQRWATWRRIQLEATADVVAEEVDTATTEIHQFDISDPDRTDYVASGSIDGFLLNQFAMSEHEGRLRVASTTQPNWWCCSERESESFVTVLEPRNGELVTIGRVGGLGKGEQIFSVRFIGDMGYVVTFRQTDPLYTIDISDPTRPTVAGELKILGFSAYLHPIGDDLILGVGQDANSRGRLKGSQLSIFDVSDPANPVRIDQLSLSKGGNSEVEYDHRAFLYWDESNLAVLPVNQWEWDRDHEHVFLGAVAVEAGSDGIVEVGRVNHPGGATQTGKYDWQAQIRRSIVIGDSLYTVSTKGILQSDLGTLEEQGWLAFN